jgi:hypothetical protein
MLKFLSLDLQYNFALAYAYKLILKSDIAADVQMELITSKKKKKSKVLFKLVHKEMSKTQRMGHIFKFVPPPPPSLSRVDARLLSCCSIGYARSDDYDNDIFCGNIVGVPTLVS